VKIVVARETREGEARVAMVPELVGKLTGPGAEVLVEPDADRHSLIADADDEAVGASVAADAVEPASRTSCSSSPRRRCSSATPRTRSASCSMR
jgi:NAD/NADP transhydrogenase alpha subunit